MDNNKKGQEEMTTQKKKKLLDNKKGQEEIAGFVVIVVIVIILGLIFLALSQNRQSVYKESNDEKRLLESMMGYTSDCAFYEPNYRKIEDLIKDCYNEPNKQCLNGKSGCEVLNETLFGMIDATYPIGEQYIRKGFIFNATYSQNASEEGNIKEIISIIKGNCSSDVYVGADYPFATFDGSITSRIRVCY